MSSVIKRFLSVGPEEEAASHAVSAREIVLAALVTAALVTVLALGHLGYRWVAAAGGAAALAGVLWGLRRMPSARKAHLLSHLEVQRATPFGSVKRLLEVAILAVLAWAALLWLAKRLS